MRLMCFVLSGFVAGCASAQAGEPAPVVVSVAPASSSAVAASPSPRASKTDTLTIYSNKYQPSLDSDCAICVPQNSCDQMLVLLIRPGQSELFRVSGIDERFREISSFVLQNGKPLTATLREALNLPQGGTMVCAAGGAMP